MSELLMQGDIALREVPEKMKARLMGKLKCAASVKDGVIAEGEHSGHAHVVCGDARLVEVNGRMYVVTGQAASSVKHLKHLSAPADHGPLELEPQRCYEVILQNEYNPYEKVLERVLD